MVNKEALELEYLPIIFSLFEMRQLQPLNTSQSAERNGSLGDSYPETWWYSEGVTTSWDKSTSGEVSAES